MKFPKKSERRAYASRLMKGSVLGDWFSPLTKVLEDIRFSDRTFCALPMHAFILYGCMRQVQSIATLREQIQTLFHMDHDNNGLPLAKSTFADAMASHTRCPIVRQAVCALAQQTQLQLPDKLVGVDGLGTREIIAIDATYQKESGQYRTIHPSDDGTDNQKGHLLLTFYDVRKGIPIDVVTQTQSIAEVRLLKQGLEEAQRLMQKKNAIYVIDRAFIDGYYWDARKRKYHSTVVTRMKSSLVYTTDGQDHCFSNNVCNEGVLYDRHIMLNSAKQPWRLIGFRAPDGTQYEYLSNDFELEPGVIAFLYYRRWDEEKYFDNFKNDLSGAKAWSKSSIGIEQQALLAIITYLLTRLFLHRNEKPLSLKKADATQDYKHARKQEQYLSEKTGVAYRAYYAGLSKITRQVWRFLKSCFLAKSSLDLYLRQLKPMLVKYL